MLIFGLNNEVKAKVNEEYFDKYVKRLYNLMEKKIDKLLFDRDGQIDLVLTDDEAIHALNLEYRGVDESTDVLAFAYLEVTEFEQEEGDIVVGDVFISVETAKKQAKEKRHTLKEELAILFVHGLLHLFGLDHKNNKEEEEMEKWAEKILL